jgi:hypothetical protein
VDATVYKLDDVRLPFMGLLTGELDLPVTKGATLDTWRQVPEIMERKEAAQAYCDHMSKKYVRPSSPNAYALHGGAPLPQLHDIPAIRLRQNGQAGRVVTWSDQLSVSDLIPIVRGWPMITKQAPSVRFLESYRLGARKWNDIRAYCCRYTTRGQLVVSEEGVRAISLEFVSKMSCLV